MGLGMTGFTPKRNLSIESTALWRDFLPFSQGPGAAGRDRQGPVVGGCANLTTTPGRYLGGSPFLTSTLGCVRMDKNIRIHHGKTKTAVTGSKVKSWERWGGAGQPLPLLQQHQLNSCIEGLGVCKAGGWNKMAAAKSSLKHPKLLMCMKPRQQHPFRTPEGTKARASPLSHSAGATCCSLNSTRNVAGMKVALPARVLTEPKSKDCQVKRVKPPRTAVSDWLYIISIASSTGIII